eukprot:14000806-Alexandrium_andersonii.AAC.1
MSASLVGSEMCIRDRSLSASAPSDPQKGLALGASALAEGLPFGDLGAEAVSYTHLTLPTICSV